MKKKLLLADDSITIQKVVGIIFSTEDYELATVSDGDKAFELTLAQRPDLVIADIAMPGKNGFELCRAIKSHPDLGSTSVMLLPGAFEEFDESRAVEVCADGWLTKPFESQALLDKVAALFAMPPLRLVPAAVAAEDEAAPEVDTDLLAETVDAGFYGAEEVLSEDADLAAEETLVAAEDSDSHLWGEVSFAEEDLKPQELLAAGDQDDPLEFTEAEEEIPASPGTLSPEQLAPYVPVAPPQPVPEQIAEFEPLPAATDEEFEYLTDDTDDTLGEKADDVEVDQLDEPAAAFTFAGDEEEETLASVQDDTEEILELLEEDLEQSDELVEDEDTFVDLATEGEELVAEALEADAGDLLDEELLAEEDEVLELTEGDILDEEDVAEPVVTAAALSSALMEVEDETFVEPEDVVTADVVEDDVVEPQFGRRDDDLFGDEEESVEAAPADEPIAVAAPIESEPVALDEPATAEVAEEVEEVAASPVAAVIPPVVAPAAEVIETQLRQLPEDELRRMIEKVAGPLIDNMAREMLQQIVWEVVPDLAEAMISAEIEKIKRGEV